MNSMIDVVDNFLNEKDFDEVFNTISSNNFPWFTIDRLNENADNDNDFQLIHTIISDGQPNSNFTNIIDITCKPMPRINIYRARVNLFTKTHVNKNYGFHKDMDNAKTLLLYLEDSNGYTEFEDGIKVESKQNRAVLFNSDFLHQTVSQTDVKFRRNININFNYINER